MQGELLEDAQGWGVPPVHSDLWVALHSVSSEAEGWHHDGDCLERGKQGQKHAASSCPVWSSPCLLQTPHRSSQNECSLRHCPVTPFAAAARQEDLTFISELKITVESQSVTLPHHQLLTTFLLVRSPHPRTGVGGGCVPRALGVCSCRPEVQRKGVFIETFSRRRLK